MAEPPIDHRAVRRVNLSVPVADQSILRWLDLQENKSVSVRTIIREYIERDGYTDPLCRPVVQGPRRGRPPLMVENTPQVVETPIHEVRDDESVPDHLDHEGTSDERGSNEQHETVVQNDATSADEEIQLDENGMPILDY